MPPHRQAVAVGGNAATDLQIVKMGKSNTRQINNKGPIAKSYKELQALPKLEKANNFYPVRKASPWSITKSILQSSEIGIQNLNGLVQRIIVDLKHDRIQEAVVKMGWVKDITRLMLVISNYTNSPYYLKPLNGNLIKSTDRGNVDLENSLKKLDNKLINMLKRLSENSSNPLETQRDFLYKLSCLYRVTAYEIALFDNNLSKVQIPKNTSYSNFIGLKYLNLAIREPHLKGDTFFTQFRCIHQIPEILTSELNSHLQIAISNILKKKNQEAHKKLCIANSLFSIAVEALFPIVNNLTHDDYHKIRRNLGLTSGSHSVNIHFTLFRDIYSQLASNFISLYWSDLASYKKIISQDYELKLIEIELLKLRNSIRLWRELHLHLPRTNLGEHEIKSLIGSKEAVEAARKMQINANQKDPLNKVAALYQDDYLVDTSTLSAYIMSKKSLDFYIGLEIGKITQKRFSDVQNRKGIFSDKPKFKNPKAKKA